MSLKQRFRSSRSYSLVGGPLSFYPSISWFKTFPLIINAYIQWIKVIKGRRGRNQYRVVSSFFLLFTRQGIECYTGFHVKGLETHKDYTLSLLCMHDFSRFALLGSPVTIKDLVLIRPFSLKGRKSTTLRSRCFFKAAHEGRVFAAFHQERARERESSVCWL